MSTAATEHRPLAASAASTVWPVLFLVAVAGVCWAVTVERMGEWTWGRDGPRLVRRRLGHDATFSAKKSIVDQSAAKMAVVEVVGD